MIITRKYAQKLVRERRAWIDGAVYEPDRFTGERASVIVVRNDISRIDHYDYAPADKEAIDRCERIDAESWDYVVAEAERECPRA